jgi:flagellar basal-body rod modification protein FlgD
MEASAITTATQASPTGGEATSDAGMTGLNAEDFFKILITQLQSQDPLEPMKNNEMLGQIAQIRQMESSSKLNQVLEDLAGKDQMTRAVSLIGKFVQGGAAGQTEAAGVVTGIHVEDGAFKLELDNGQTLDVQLVQFVTIADTAQNQAGGE